MSTGKWRPSKHMLQGQEMITGWPWFIEKSAYGNVEAGSARSIHKRKSTSPERRFAASPVLVKMPGNCPSSVNKEAVSKPK